jgi:hypothetical protein
MPSKTTNVALEHLMVVYFFHTGPSMIPQNPKIYHITHVTNLPSIVNDQRLWSDMDISMRAISPETIGMQDIKARRMNELLVKNHDGLYVGGCVPFYFCPRSIMLYMMHKRNPKLKYQGGQESIIHLEADLYRTINWAKTNNRRWAFSLSNAGARYAEFCSSESGLDKLDWNAIATNEWQDQEIKEAKQAEFLLESQFPWQLIDRIGVISTLIEQEVSTHTISCQHRPQVVVRKDWYY